MRVCVCVFLEGMAVFEVVCIRWGLFFSLKCGNLVKPVGLHGVCVCVCVCVCVIVGGI